MNKFLILIIIGIFLIPISSIIPSLGGLWYSQYISLSICLFFGIALFLWNFNKTLAIFDIICILSAFLITNLNSRAIILLFNLNFGCLGVYLLSKFNQQQRQVIIRSIFILFLLQYLWLILQANNISIPINIKGRHIDITFKSIYDINKKELVAFSASPDQLGTFFALTLPVALYIHPLFALLSLAGIFISKSAFAFISGISGGLIYFYFIRKKIFKILLILILPIFLLFYFKYADKLTSADFKTRGGVWKYAIQSTLKGNINIEHFGNNITIKTNSLYGYGLGKFLLYFPFVPQKSNHFNFATEKFNHAHNDYIEIFFELGIIGIISLIALLTNFFKNFISAKKSKELIMLFSCLVVYLLNSSGNFLSQIAVSGMLLMIYYGMFKGAMRENGQTTASC